jgi:hypothetical protein
MEGGRMEGTERGDQGRGLRGRPGDILRYDQSWLGRREGEEGRGGGEGGRRGQG